MRRWSVLVLVLLMIPALTACRSIGERVTEEAAERLAEEATGLENIDVDEEEGTASFEVETEEGSAQMEVGGNIPDDFSLPLPSEYEVQQAVEGEQEEGAFLQVVILFPTAEAEDLADRVEEHLTSEGYQVNRGDVVETLLTVRGETPEEDGRVVHFQIVLDEDAPESVATYQIVTPTG